MNFSRLSTERPGEMTSDLFNADHHGNSSHFHQVTNELFEITGRDSEKGNAIGRVRPSVFTR